MKINVIFIIFLILISSLCDTIRELSLKSAINSLNFNVDGIKKALIFIIKVIALPKAWLAFVFSVLSLLIYLFVLSKADLNFAFSLDSMHYVLIAIASHLILKEKFEASRWVGTILIVLGIIAVSMS